MKKYRIIQKGDILCDGMEEKAALETLQMFQSLNPDKIFELEEYHPLTNRLGRDPDLY